MPTIAPGTFSFFCLLGLAAPVAAQDLSSCPLDAELNAEVGSAPDPVARFDAAKGFFRRRAEEAGRSLTEEAQQVQNDPNDARRTVIAQAWRERSAWFQSQAACLAAQGAIARPDVPRLLETVLLGGSPLRDAYQRLYGRPPEERVALDLASKRYLAAFDLAVGGGSGGFGFRDGNDLEVLVDGKPFREKVIGTVRGAERFVHVSSLHLAQDRFGKELAAELVGKKLGYADGDAFKAYLAAKGWDLTKDGDKIRRDYVQAKTGERPTDAAEADRKFLELTKDFEVRLLLDFHTTRLSPIKNPDVGPGNVLPVLRSFGAQVSYLPSFIFMVNHAKLIASDKQAVVSGGNFIDKVVNWDWGKVEFHDAAVAVKGELVNDLNRFFLLQYNRFLDTNAIARWVDVPGQVLGAYRNAGFDKVDLSRPAPDGTPYYFPPQEAAGGSKARIVQTINGEARASVNAKTLSKVIRDAERFIYLENPFFSDGAAAGWLIDKAESWKLREEKAKNGEVNEGEAVAATCDLDKIHARPSGRGIVVVLPSKHDQPLVKVANDSLINPLLNAGVDVCKWDGALYNRRKEEAAAGATGELHDLLRRDLERGYEDDAMLHSKVWSVDGKLGYIGSANLTVRSQKGDLELGVMTSDPEVVREIDTRIMRLNVWNSRPTQARKVNYLWWPVRMFLTRVVPAM